MVQSPSWKANWCAASQKFPAFHGTRRFITVLTSVRHLSLSWAKPIQSTYPHPTSWRSILISSSATNISVYCALMIMPQVLLIFTPYSPWHILQQFKYSKTSTVYIFLTSLCASCFCTVCLVHLVIRIKLKMWMGEDSASQYASCIHSKHNKAVWCLLSVH